MSRFAFDHPVFQLPRLARNTANARLCRTCHGEGATETQVGLCDFRADHCDDCDGEGWIKWREPDPLEELRLARIRLHSGYWRASEFTFRKYQEARARAMT